MADETIDPYAETGAERNKEAAKERRRVKDRNNSDIVYLLKRPEFRRFYWRLLVECQVFGASFNMNQKVQDWIEGKRDIGIKFLTELNKADATIFYQMMREDVSEKQSRKKEKQE